MKFLFMFFKFDDSSLDVFSQFIFKALELIKLAN